MLDFNDIPKEQPQSALRDEVKQALLSRLDSVLERILPGGRIHGQRFVVGNIQGDPGESLSVTLDGESAGLWLDFATGEGGDIFDLVAATHGLDAKNDFTQVLEIAQNILGQAPKKVRRQKQNLDDLFQSEIDPWMAVRIMVYVGLLYQDLIKSGAVKTGELLPPVFPLVLYRGASAWNAREEVSELIVPTSRFLAKYHPSLRYFLVDARHTPEENLQNESAASLFVRMERRDDLQDLSLDLARFMQIFSGPKYLSLRRALTVWAKRVLRQRLGENVQIPDVTELEEVIAMLADKLPLFSEKWISEGEAIGRKEGRKEGEAQGAQPSCTASLSNASAITSSICACRNDS